MYPVPAPPSTSLPGELPLREGEEEEHHEKKPVLKKVMDKVKKIKKAISMKTPVHGNEGDDDDHPQKGDLDEGDEEYEEDEEIKEDPSVHGVPMPESSAAGIGIGSNKMSGGGGEDTEGAGDGLSLILEDQAKPRTYHETCTIIEQNRSSPKARIEQTRDYESPANGATTGAKEISEGEGADGVGNCLRLTTEKFAGDLAQPTTDAKANISPEHESPATIVRTAANEISGGGREVAEGVGDGLCMIKEESVEDPAAPRNEVYESPATGARTGVNDVSGGGVEGAERAKDCLGFITEEFFENPTAPTTDAEIDTRNEQSQSTGARTRANEMFGEVEGAKGGDDGPGLITMDFVKDPAAATDYQTNEKIELSKVHLSPTTSATTGVNEISGGGKAEAADGVVDGLGLIPMELVEDPAAPKAEAETNTKTEQSQGGEVVDVSPELCRTLESMAISTHNNKRETELSKDKNNSYTDMVSSAASKVYGIVADAGTAVISKMKLDSGKGGEGEAVGKQGMGISIKEYITDKLKPGEDEKALSDLITEVGQKRKNSSAEVLPPEKTSSQDGGRGVGVVEKIRETVTSFLGGGESSPKSPPTEAHGKVVKDDNDFLRRTPEAISNEKRSSEELPP